MIRFIGYGYEASLVKSQQVRANDLKPLKLP